MHKLKEWILDEICANTDKKCRKRHFKILIPHICGYLAEKYVEEEIEKMKKYEYVIKEAEDLDNLIDTLKKYSDKEVDRDKVINDKVKSSLFVIVLSITFLTGIIKSINSMNIVSEFLIVIGLIYLFFSGITAVQSILPRRYHNVIINDKINRNQIFPQKQNPTEDRESFEITNENLTKLENYFEIGMFKNRKIEATKLYKSIIINDQIILKKINYMDVTFHGIILGTLFITASFILICFNI